MKDSQIVKRADLALSDLTGGTGGGLLAAEQSDRFIRTMIDSPTILRDARVIPMASPQMEVNKIKFGSRILKASSQDPAEASTHDGRYLKSTDRSKPTTNKVLLSVVETMAEIRLSYEVLEDNIERGNFANTLLALIAERAALDVEELIIQGDTANGSDTYLALLEGVLEQATTNVVDFGNNPISASRLSNMVKALPTAFRRNPSALRFYFPKDVEQDMRLAFAGRGTALGDQILTGQGTLPIMGSPLVGVALMPAANGIYTNPENIIVGFHRDIRIEADRDIRSRELIYVVSLRLDVKLEEETAVVKATNVGAVS